MMTKGKYKNIRVHESTHDELRKFKNLYELQDNRSYDLEDAIILLMKDRGFKQFILPITKDKKEAIQLFSQSSQ